MEQSVSLQKTASSEIKRSLNELLSSVFNVGGETLYAQMHHEDTLCCVRAWSVHWFPTARSSRDKQQMSSFVTSLRFSWTAVSSHGRAGPGNSESIFIRVRTTIDITVYISHCSLHSHFASWQTASTDSKSCGRHIFWINPQKTQESDNLNFKGWFTGCRRKVIKHADR